MNLKQTSAMLFALIFAGCTAQAAEQAAQGSPAPAPAAPAGPPPGMPKPVTMVDRPNASGGEKLYVEKCAMCHAPNGMGYGLLARRTDQPDLEKRDDLVPRIVNISVRSGIGNMPAIPRGEVSNEELQAIVDYLTSGPHGDGQ